MIIKLSLAVPGEALFVKDFVLPYMYPAPSIQRDLFENLTSKTDNRRWRKHRTIVAFGVRRQQKVRTTAVINAARMTLRWQVNDARTRSTTAISQTASIFSPQALSIAPAAAAANAPTSLHRRRIL